MKRALIKNNILLLLSAFTLFFIIVFFTLYFFEQNNKKVLMTFILNEVELEYNNFDGSHIDFVATFSGDFGRRITIIDSNKLVLADSNDPRVGLDKSDRPEIINLGEVFSRNSDTVNINLLYIAKELDDGNILRIAIPFESQSVAYTQVIITLLFSSVGFIIIFYFGLVQVNKNLLSPWQQVKKGLNALNQGSYQMMSTMGPYEEINEIIHEMNDINYETAKNLKAIENYQNQLVEILNELKQGVILLDHDENIIYFNDDAKKYLNFDDDVNNKPSYYAIRDFKLKEAITKVNLNKKVITIDILENSKIIETTIFYILKDGMSKKEATILVLLRDVSQERAIEQMKKDFFSYTSHELKSPLTAVKGYAELISHQLVDIKEYSHIANEIVKQSDHMTLLVEDMLMLSRLENLNEKNYSINNLDQILKDSINSLKSFSESKLIKINISSKSILYNSDPIDIQKLFKNLIENSIKYSEKEKEINIDLSENQNEIIFTIKDQGIGIEKKHQQRVFERFYRVDKGRFDGGTGLGLAIVKHIALKYNGKVELESSLSKGTKITVYLKK
jgi:two-component system, OmpR family, phosphate regulon sensor histidine kinase PhoR